MAAENTAEKVSSHFSSPSISFHFLSQQGLRVEMETERLYIRSYMDEDFENCVVLYGDEKLTRFFHHGKARSRQEVALYIQEIGDRYFLKGEPFGLFSVFTGKNGAFIGQVLFVPTEEKGVAEILGLILHRQYHHQGLPFEVLQIFIKDYVKKINRTDFRGGKFRIHKIIATAHPKNYSPQRLLNKLGMTFDRFGERFGGLPRLWYSLVV